MSSRITPMIHVPDVRATAVWYRSIGFRVVGWHGCDAQQIDDGPLPESDMTLDWAMLRWGDSEVMLSAGGAGSDAARRDVDLYVHLAPERADQSVDALYEHLRDKAEIVEAPHDAFHGNREVIVRDPNGFWITFAEPTGAASSA